MQIQCKQKTLYLSGQINVQSINSKVWQDFSGSLNSSEIEQIDFSGVEHADSVAIALILAALRRKEKITLHALPIAVQDLAALYEIKDWIK